jgi:hypothetical protein
MQKPDKKVFYEDIINKSKGFKSELLYSLKNHIRNGYYLAIIDNPLKKVSFLPNI